MRRRLAAVLGVACLFVSMNPARVGATTASETITTGGAVSWTRAELLDGFARTVANGWGSPDIPGPPTAWTVSTTPAQFSTAGGWGLINAAAGATERVQFSTFPTDIGATAKISLPAGAGATAVSAGLTFRNKAGANWFEILASATGSGTVKLLGQLNGGGGNLWAPFDTGIAVASPTVLRLHVTIAGWSPTVINASLWLDGSSEPGAFQATASDNTAAWQNSGGKLGAEVINNTAGALQAKLTLIDVENSFYGFGFPASTLNGTDVTVHQSYLMNVVDPRGSGAGWSLTLTSTQFTNGTTTLPASATLLNSLTLDACDPGSTCVLATGSLSYPLTIPAGPGPPAPVKILQANATTGLGSQTEVGDLSLTVPAGATVGTYSSTWTFTLQSAP